MLKLNDPGMVGHSKCRAIARPRHLIPRVHATGIVGSSQCNMALEGSNMVQEDLTWPRRDLTWPWRDLTWPERDLTWPGRDLTYL